MGVRRNGLTLLERAYGMADLEHAVLNRPGTIFEPLGLHDTDWRDDSRRLVPGRSSAYEAVDDGSESVYAGGLRIEPFRGVRSVTHTGATAGYRAFLGQYPDQGLSSALRRSGRISTPTRTLPCEGRRPR